MRSWERLTFLRAGFAALATDIRHVGQTVLCDHKGWVEEGSIATLGPPPPFSSGRARGSEDALSRWAEDNAEGRSSGGTPESGEKHGIVIESQQACCWLSCCWCSGYGFKMGVEHVG